MSNEELGELYAETVRQYAARRTGNARDFWRKLLDEPDMVGVLEEFRRRAMRREREYYDWLESVEARDP